MYRCLLVSEKWQDYSSSLTSKSWDSWLVLSHLETNVVSSSGFLTRQSFLSLARKWKCPNMTDTAVHNLFFGSQRRSRWGTNMSILTIEDEIYSIPLTKKRNMITKFRNTNLSSRKSSVIFVLNKNNGRFSWGEIPTIRTHAFPHLSPVLPFFFLCNTLTSLLACILH
jgi:hypothetical protein